MAKRKYELPSAAAGQGDEPAREQSRPLWKVSGIHGHAERVVEAESEEAAWTAYMLADGLLGSAHRPDIKRVEVTDAPA